MTEEDLTPDVLDALPKDMAVAAHTYIHRDCKILGS